MTQTPNNPPPPPVNDPMFRTLDKTGPLEKAMRKNRGNDGGKTNWILPTILFVCILGLLAYILYLHTEISVHRDHLLELDEGVDATDTRLDQMEEKLYKTEDVLAAEINRTGQALTELGVQQTRAVERIRQDITRKADREEVKTVEMQAQNLTNDVGSLKTNLTDVDTNVKQVDTKVENLNEKVNEQAKTIEEQRQLIEGNMVNINATKTILDDTRDSLLNLKTSLDRNYHVFQLDKRMGIIRVSDIGLRLKKTKDKKQEYEVEVFYDDQKMKKKGVSNVPINFYKMGYRKHYELVISKVEKNKVSGYLSTPKVKD
jgi:hypothetical protein